MGGFNAVLLDIDGTLVDSNDLHAKAWVEACIKCDWPVTFEQVRPLIGMGGDLLLKKLFGLDPDSAASKKIRSERGRLFKARFLPSVRPFPSAREFVERCQRAGLRCVAASSSSESDVERLLAIAGVDDLIDDATTASEAERTKPCPDIIEAAVDKSGEQPGRVVLVGDTPYDLEAAHRAGVAMLAVRSGGWSDEQFRGALAVFDDVEDLLYRWEDSPLAER